MCKLWFCRLDKVVLVERRVCRLDLCKVLDWLWVFLKLASCDGVELHRLFRSVCRMDLCKVFLRSLD